MPASAERIKDLGQFQGLRANQLTGYGLVVGLAGTGDDSLDYATLAMKGAVSRFGLTLPAGVNPSLKNVAAVMITAELPPFCKTRAAPGHLPYSQWARPSRFAAGRCFMAPLYGADGQIYAMAQGNLVVGGLGIDAADGSKVAVNVPSAGRVDGGATVERSVDTGFTNGDQLVINLHDQDLTNAKLVAEAINRTLGAGTAQASDGCSISTCSPRRASTHQHDEHDREYRDQAVRTPARVIVNSRTGTVVINGSSPISTAAVTHGKLTVRVDEKPRVIQPEPFSRGQTALEPNSDIKVEEARNPMFLMPKGASLQDIVKAINRIGASPGDLVAILEALKEAGDVLPKRS